jgi:branched-chain amino acid transport system substrate-binding protein
LFAQISKAQPDLIFLGDAYATANVLVAQARKKGITTRFFGGDGWDSTELDLQATDGDYFATHFSPVDQRNVVQEWVKAYQARYQALPDGLAALGYDAANLVLSAIAKAGEDDPTKVAQALEGLSLEGVTGKISFNSQHNPIKPVAIMEVKGGQVRYVTSVKP